MSAGVATRRQRPFTAAQQTAARSRVPGLDGVRAVAVLLVVSSHTALTPVLNPGGSFGVTVFFVLSGYLITGLLLAEFRRNGRIDLRRFWLRRALRLLPALWVMLTVISLLARQERWLSWRQLRSAVGPGLFYYADYVPAAQLYLFGHTWSLAVEEQFYVLWPLVIIGLGIAARRRRWILGSALVALTAVGIAWRLHVGGNPENRAGYDAAVRHLDTCGFALVAGAVLATMPLARPGRAPRIPGWVPAVAFLGTLAICDRSHQLHLRLNGVTAPLLFTVTAAVVIISCAGGQARWLDTAVLRWLGRRSYAWYLWHFPFVWAVVVGPVRIAGPVVSGVGAGLLGLLCAELSWWLVERPCQKLKARLAAEPRASARPRSRPAPN